MALKGGEIQVLGILGLIILILWAFFGLLWSFLLVFTFLIYAYNFGRGERTNIRVENSLPEDADEADVTQYQDKLPNYYAEYQDYPFTGLQKEQFTLRSPAPLLSNVTKRLSFNSSTIISPFQERKTMNNSTDCRELGTSYQSRGSSVGYWRKSNHFSLLNPALERPCTVKIASPNVAVNRTFNLSNSPLKRKTPDQINPCSRASVMSALKESRKRARFAVDDEDDDSDLVLRPSKRRSCKYMDTVKDNVTLNVPLPFNRPFFGNLKRPGIHGSDGMSTDKATSKRSKSEDVITLSETEIVKTHPESALVLQKRKEDYDTSLEDSEENTSKRAKISSLSVDPKEKSPTDLEKEQVATIATDSAVSNEPESDSDHNTDQERNESKYKESSVTNHSSSDCEDDKSSSQGSQQNNTEENSVDEKDKCINSQPNQSRDSAALNKTKRFNIPRFLSKADSRRRAVPVYCASNDESEMPQRRYVARKINQEQMKIDRKLAWERVKRFLDDDDDEEEEDEEEKDEAEKTSKSGAGVVSSTTKSVAAASLFKIPLVPAATTIGTVTTTTQSLVTPILATGNPQQTQRGLTSTVAQSTSNGTGGTAGRQPQASLRNLLQSQQTTESGSFANFSSAQGTSFSATTTSTTKENNSSNTSSLSGLSNPSNSSLSGLQTKTTLTSTAAGLGKDGFIFSSPASLSGDSFLTKPAKTDQSIVLPGSIQNKTLPSGLQFSSNFGQSTTNSIFQTTQNSTEKVAFGFPTASSSGMSQTSTSSSASVKATFNFGTLAGNHVGNPGVAQSSSEDGQIKDLSSNSSRSTGAFGGMTSRLTQSPFASLVTTTQSGLPSTSLSSTSVFGNVTNATQGKFGSTAQNKAGFGFTNMPSVTNSMQQGQSTAGTALEGSLNKTPTQKPFGQSAFGSAQANQAVSAPLMFGAIPSTNAFGVQQNSQSAFGLNTAKCRITFGSQGNQTAEKNKAESQPATFGSQQNQNAVQSSFGAQTTQNAFGAQLNQPATQNPFRTQAAQNAFGSQQPSQSAFGTPTPAKFTSKSAFSFAVNAAQTPSSSPFGSFGNKTGTSTQDAAGSSDGFNFSSPAGTSAPGAFNFNTAGNKQGGFQFGTASSSSISSFGQTTAGAQTANPLATPNRPSQPTGGFSFAPGFPHGPTFGVPSTPQGANSATATRARTRLTARRRGKK